MISRLIHPGMIYWMDDTEFDQKHPYIIIRENDFSAKHDNTELPEFVQAMCITTATSKNIGMSIPILMENNSEVGVRWINIKNIHSFQYNRFKKSNFYGFAGFCKFINDIEFIKLLFDLNRVHNNLHILTDEEYMRITERREDYITKFKLFYPEFIQDIENKINISKSTENDKNNEKPENSEEEKKVSFEEIVLDDVKKTSDNVIGGQKIKKETKKELKSNQKVSKKNKNYIHIDPNHTNFISTQFECEPFHAEEDMKDIQAFIIENDKHIYEKKYNKIVNKEGIISIGEADFILSSYPVKYIGKKTGISFRIISELKAGLKDAFRNSKLLCQKEIKVFEVYEVGSRSYSHRANFNRYYSSKDETDMMVHYYNYLVSDSDELSSFITEFTDLVRNIDKMKINNEFSEIEINSYIIRISKSLEFINKYGINQIWDKSNKRINLKNASAFRDLKTRMEEFLKMLISELIKTCSSDPKSLSDNNLDKLIHELEFMGDSPRTLITLCPKFYGNTYDTKIYYQALVEELDHRTSVSIQA